MEMRAILPLPLAIFVAVFASATEKGVSKYEQALNRQPRSGVALIITGAINAVAYNAIRSGRMSWKGYREILSGLRNEDVFVQTGQKIPVDTSPLRALLTHVVEGEMGYTRIGDLPIPTAITITRFSALGLAQTLQGPYRIRASQKTGRQSHLYHQQEERHGPRDQRGAARPWSERPGSLR